MRIVQQTFLDEVLVGFFFAQVFEDHFNGIICYKDARGEIICEGYDEGPRYHHQNQRIVNQSRYKNTIQNIYNKKA